MWFRKRALFLLAALVLPAFAGCSDATQPVAPPAQGTPPGSPPTPPVSPPIGISSFPALTRSGRIYAAAPGLNELYTQYHGAGLESRYVLYDDHSFALQFVSGRFGVFEYDGSFTGADTLTFTWKGWSLAGPWGSEATLRGDTLSVRYNLIMQLTDFVDGTYIRLPVP